MVVMCVHMSDVIVIYSSFDHSIFFLKTLNKSCQTDLLLFRYFNLYKGTCMSEQVNVMTISLTNNGHFSNRQSYSFITVHGQFESNGLGLYCQVTI